MLIRQYFNLQVTPKHLATLLYFCRNAIFITALLCYYINDETGFPPVIYPDKPER